MSAAGPLDQAASVGNAAAPFADDMTDDDVVVAEAAR
jgi:hypothetical protein